MSIPSNPYVPDPSRGDLPWSEYDQPDLVTTMILMRKYRKALEDVMQRANEGTGGQVGLNETIWAMHRIAREAL
jgi:hypothetical protein